MDKPGRRFFAVGDIHGDVANLARIPGISRADGVIVTGDLTIRGDQSEGKRVIEAVRAVNPAVYAQIGNMDRQEIDDWLTAEEINIHRRVVELAPGLGLMGIGWSTPTPFGTPSEISEAGLSRWIDETHALAGSYSDLVVVVHTPPYGTATDRLPSGGHVGSPAVRAFLERVQPLLCVTGHIHESRAVDLVGTTTVINPGPLAAGGYVRIDVGRDLPHGVEAALAVI
ncbi:metallophosphoesterase family protein [Desulfolutivibrio sulfoxidireducens]|uniref:metallophosphoesterase family protein n=1 Tax=Desulfolutivibrio sulfoxidireducens TaxID=2773299 RepID=UPI00159DA92F|nr:metallophosphoesterase [Desulfolutivibrio sulfoxidireducens]QLA16931.1 serine/threonine protein phosphatase [Desulfolutivibrio sulfoxidireducens]QLA20497.1 serine/threonine protein phosphatase [Desulfolutivibrio sulfoxidireducens]